MPKYEDSPEQRLTRAQMLNEAAVEGLDTGIAVLASAVQRELPVSNLFRTAKVAMEALLPSASDDQKLRWAKMLLEVANATTGDVQVEAYALAYKLAHPLT